jgi:hypothetical protein
MSTHWSPLNLKSNLAQLHKRMEIKEVLNLIILKKEKSKEGHLME